MRCNCRLKISNRQTVTNIREILKKYWGYDDFRGIQREIIESIIHGHDTLGLMPTGGGKSITFQVPAIAMEGLCLVITPLIALMKDQVDSLRRHSLSAAYISSDMTHAEILAILENCVFGAIKFLYISPERLTSELFITKLKHTKVCFVCVDEAHCISQWGYDFRPSYLQISKIRQIKPDKPILALTATATPKVVEDIQQQLMFRQHNVLKMSFERKNLAYIVRHSEKKEEEMVRILRKVNGSAIVYTRSRKGTKEVAAFLNEAGISATFFHAGLDPLDKNQRQNEWIENKVRVMVATNAFGMGIDKPDVRLVIHINCPDSIEAYFQEAGRAGRDGNKAYAVLLFNKNDKIMLRRRIKENFPDKAFIKQIYDELAFFFQLGIDSGYNHSFDFNLELFCVRFQHHPIHVRAALLILTKAGYIDYDEERESATRLMFCLERDELYRLYNNSKDEDRLIEYLLRKYGGLFSDYVPIDEQAIQHSLNIKKQYLHQILINLSRKHIIKYIPSKTTPVIRYTQRREDSAHIVIGKDIYEERLAQFKERINSVIRYCEENNLCRSRMLLDYFGEQNTHDCKVCDTCINRKSNATDIDSIIQSLQEQLADHAPHSVEELQSAVNTSDYLFKIAVAVMTKENMICMDDDNRILLRNN